MSDALWRCGLGPSCGNTVTFLLSLSYINHTHIYILSTCHDFKLFTCKNISCLRAGCKFADNFARYNQFLCMHVYNYCRCSACLGCSLSSAMDESSKATRWRSLCRCFKVLLGIREGCMRTHNYVQWYCTSNSFFR